MARFRNERGREVNLHQIAAPYVSKVNPWVIGQWQQSLGSQQNASGKRAPTYSPPLSVQIQMQALQWKDVQQIQGLNLQGVREAMYITGNIQGVSRPDVKGGDLITLPDGKIFLVAVVLENWSETAGWTKVGVTQQND
jgi:hypothetical protein